jgi:hypothetical protein
MLIDGSLPIGLIWKRENRVSSDADTMEVSLKNLIPDATGQLMELFGNLVKVDGKTKLNGVFRYGPFEGESKLTADGFDQVQLYHSLNDVQEYLGRLGVDIPSILARQHNGGSHPIKAHANAVEDLNAWYDSESDDLTFGTGEGKWHLASDSDISVHESGHMMLDHINSKLGNWWSGEGRAIHEGFGDALAALRSDDAELSEDFAAYEGGSDSKTAGLRTAKNELTLKDVGTEEHDRGQVYAGFFWSVREKIEALGLTGREAADVTLELMFAHSFKYKTVKPKPRDFVDAMIAGAESLAAEGRLAVDIETAKTIITEEAKRRGFLDPVSADEEPEDIFANVTALEERFGGGGLLRFVPDTENAEQRFYQEQYQTREHGYVEVVGSGAVEQMGPTGPVVSARDVRAIGQGEIDETVNINISAAISSARTNAAMTLIQTEQRKSALESLGSRKSFMNDEDYRARLAAAQMDYRVAEAAVAELGHPGKRTIVPPQSRLVILPDSNELFYEIKAGLGMYYINAKTGDLNFERHVFVN